MPLSPVYAIYAFHTLDASLNHRKQLPLPEVEDLWSRYLAAHPQLELSSSAEDADGEVDDHGNDDETSSASAATTEGTHDDREGPGPVGAPSPSPSASSASTPSSASTANSSRTTLSSSSSHSNSNSNGNNSTFRKAVRGLERSRRRLLGSTLAPADPKPLFVTWNDVSRPGHAVLRGCIGTFEGQEVERGLRAYALTAALEDTRFPPIAARELPSLSVSITYLADFEPCSNPMAWELGEHGVRISFVWRGQRLGATYLPSVPVEQGWSKTETLVSLMRKAGWNGRREEWMRVGELSVVRYRGMKCGVTWGEYDGWKEWCELK